MLLLLNYGEVALHLKGIHFDIVTGKTEKQIKADILRFNEQEEKMRRAQDDIWSFKKIF
ncbi:MAG: hypothetical protein LBD62_05270 [Candidatus Margulisbacteria bacterium]|nr:hypothetical protein [Candidatus Margulisiibacteriota bacterium]